MKLDLHVHTTASPDSIMSREGLISAAKRAGLSGVAVCDHNVFADVRGDDEIYVIPACEVSSDVGHLLVYFIKGDICSEMEKNENGVYPWQDVIAAARRHGALVFLAHPFSPEFPRSDEFWKAVSGVEAFNARVVYSRVNRANEKAFRLWREKKLPFVVGSDAHSENEVGRAYLECDIPASGISSPDFPEKLKSAIMETGGRAFTGYSTSGVFFSCKRRVYLRQRKFKKLFKSFLLRPYVVMRNAFIEKPKKRYIDIHTEDAR